MAKISRHKTYCVAVSYTNELGTEYRFFNHLKLYKSKKVKDELALVSESGDVVIRLAAIRTIPKATEIDSFVKLGDLCYNCRQPFQEGDLIGDVIHKDHKTYASHSKCPK